MTVAGRSGGGGRALPLSLILVAMAGMPIGCVAPSPVEEPEAREAREARGGPRHVLLISLDACRADRLTSYGYARETSPFIDDLARRGVLFSHAFVNTHGTSTSHATMLSSLYQQSHGVDYEMSKKAPGQNRFPRTGVFVQEILKARGFVTLAVTDGGRMDRRVGFERGFMEYWDDGGGVETGTEKLLDRMASYRSAGRPFFAFYHTYEVHSPYLPPEAYGRLFESQSSNFVATADNIRKVARRETGPTPAELARIEDMYDAGIRFTDDALRRLLARLDEMGILKDCIVVLTSDHGEELWEHGGLQHPGGSLYDELLRVPLIVSGPGVPEGRVFDGLVSSIDIVPTILGLLGVESGVPMAGRNLMDLLDGEGDRGRPVVSQYGSWGYSVRTRDWKLIHRPPRGMELYHLLTDPYERHDLAAGHPDRVRELSEELDRFWTDGIELPEAQESEAASPEQRREHLRELGYIE